MTASLPRSSILKFALEDYQRREAVGWSAWLDVCSLTIQVAPVTRKVSTHSDQLNATVGE